MGGSATEGGLCQSIKVGLPRVRARYRRGRQLSPGEIAITKSVGREIHPGPSAPSRRCLTPFIQSKILSHLRNPKPAGARVGEYELRVS